MPFVQGQRRPGLAEVLGEEQAVVAGDPDLGGRAATIARAAPSASSRTPLVRPSTRCHVPPQSDERHSPSAVPAKSVSVVTTGLPRRPPRARRAGPRPATAREQREQARADARAPSHRAKYGRSRWQACAGLLGNHARPPTTVMKFVSPLQRGHDVQVDVIGDARAGRCAQVHPEVDAVGVVDLPEHLLEPPREDHHLRELLRRRLAERAHVPPRRHHHVTAVVGVQVHHHEVQLAAVTTSRSAPPSPRARGTARSRALLSAVVT